MEIEKEIKNEHSTQNKIRLPPEKIMEET